MMLASHDRLDALQAEIAELQLRLRESEETILAIQRGDVDALVVGSEIYTLDSAGAATNRLRQDVLAQMQDAVLACDGQDRVIFMNQAAERQYRRTASQALGHQRKALFTEMWRDEAAHEASQAAMLDGGVFRGHSIHRRMDGSQLHVDSTVSPLRMAVNDPIGHLYVIRDITERVQAEQSLQAAAIQLARRERQFSTLVENSPDIFARMDAQFRHIYVSPIVERYTGLSADAYIGKTNAELGMPIALVQRWNAALTEVFSTGQIGRIKFSWATINGHERVFDSRLVPEFDDHGGVESVLSVAVDVTEQEMAHAALQESQSRLQFTLESARIGDWTLDMETGQTKHSLRHDLCFGYDQPLKQWGKEIMLDHVHAHDKAHVMQAFSLSERTGQDLRFECRVIWPDATVHWIEVHGSSYGVGSESKRFTGIVANITQRKLAEQALHEADRKKDEFLATLAHELRNPLAPISNALQIMRLSDAPKVHENARHIIERQLGQMVHLVDDLLDVSRISQGKVELRREEADMAVIMQTAIETSRPLIQAGKHELTVRLPPPGSVWIDGDVTRLCQIVANLLNNAAKYTPQGGRIEVSGQCLGAQAVIVVQDTGIGIPPQLLPRVFDMFAQVDRTLDRSQGGLGIGLALVKRLVEMHGGTVEGYSAGTNRGSRFTVRMPCLSRQAATHQDLSHAHPSVKPCHASRVLVVDDNIDSANSLSQVFEMLGYETATAHDGAQALEMVHAFRPRVVVLDIGLPRLNGHEVAQHIRSETWGGDMLLIALSGWGQEEDRRKSKEAGFDHHFVKPVDLSHLIEAVDREKSL